MIHLREVAPFYASAACSHLHAMLALVSFPERGFEKAAASAAVTQPAGGEAPKAGIGVIRHEAWPRAGDRTRHRPETWPRAGDRTRHRPETWPRAGDRTRHRPEAWWMLLVLAFMACNVFLGLATSAVNDFEEARYG